MSEKPSELSDSTLFDRTLIRIASSIPKIKKTVPRFEQQPRIQHGTGGAEEAEVRSHFSLNHTCAMLRANLNRLFRKTWCTTKKIQGLVNHLLIYVAFHNRRLTEFAAYINSDRGQSRSENPPT
jgi:hypothetical protein